MVRMLIIAAMLSLVTVGCTCEKMTRISCDTKEVYKEVLYCPAPPDVERPELPIQQMTPDQKNSDGELVKHWNATVEALLGYIAELEGIVENQKEINRAYEEKKKELESSQPDTE